MICNSTLNKIDLILIYRKNHIEQAMLNPVPGREKATHP